TQREIGVHSLSQEAALRGALRQDPDVIIVGELRTPETTRLAVTAAETGHLVLATLNTTTAIPTISRVVDSFPADEQGVIRNMLSESLRGIVCQQLLKRKDGQGMVTAFEI